MQLTQAGSAFVGFLFERKIMSRKLALIALVLVSVYSASAMAVDFSPVVSVNGFGTVGAVHSNLDLADYSNSAFQPDGAGFNHKWSPEVDSLFGLQLAGSYRKWKVVVQGVTKQNPDDNWGPIIEWANVRYSFNDHFSAKVGRFAMPTYMGSDTRLVHYANTAVRPSTELYRLLPVTTTDGIDLSYGFSTGPIKHTTRVVWGRNRTAFANNAHGRNKGIWAIVNDMEYGDFTVHAAYQIRQLHLVQSPTVTFKTQPFRIADLGINYDNGKWVILVEAARTWLRPELSPSSLAYMVNTGLRFGKFTPYVQYGKLDPVDDVLNSGTRSPASNTKTAGVRWDFYRNLALKAQYDHAQAQNGSRGGFIHAQPGYPVDGSADMVSVVVDFVF